MPSVKKPQVSPWVKFKQQASQAFDPADARAMRGNRVFESSEPSVQLIRRGGAPDPATMQHLSPEQADQVFAENMRRQQQNQALEQARAAAEAEAAMAAQGWQKRN